MFNLFSLFAIAALAQDWPQFLGPSRDGVYGGELPSGKLVWTRDVGQGFSAPVLAAGKLVLFHRVRDRETVEALDAKTGRTLWSFDYATAYRDDFGFDEGPRAAPAIAGGRVYTFGAEGALHCLDFATGKKLWSVDTHRQFGVRKGFFGAACSPLVEGGRVMLNIGAKGAGVAAFDAGTGKTLWTATDDEAGYASPVAAEIGGLRRVLFFTRNGLAGVDPATGKVAFQFAWRSRSQASVNAASPAVAGGLVFLSASYGTGATALRIEGGRVAQVWASDEALSSHYASIVHRDGFLYGYHGRQEEGPSLRCVELKTGRVAWSVESFGAGTVTLARDRLLLVKETGEVVIAEASPKAFRQLSKWRALPPTVRGYPALAAGRVYLRNQKTLVCLE